MQQVLNTLFVTTHNSYIRLGGSTLCIELDGEKKLQVPLHHLNSVVCFGDVMLTPAVMHRCAEDGRNIVLLDRNGFFRARIEGPTSGNVLLRQAQHKMTANLEFQIKTCRSFLAGKLRNSRQNLVRAARETNDENDIAHLNTTSKLLANYITKLTEATDIDVLRGFEGDAARSYFACLNNIIRKDKRELFRMTERSRRPPRDRINALLSFLYALLMNDCRSAIEGVGLDPQLGFLHAVRPGRAALALDLMEEFRPILADRLALSMINLGQLGADDFDDRVGAVYLNDAGRKMVLATYQKRKQDVVMHPLTESQTSYGLLPHIQARLLARTIRGDMETYLPFLYR